jgi:hypothetical protein
MPAAGARLAATVAILCNVVVELVVMYLVWVSPLVFLLDEG